MFVIGAGYVAEVWGGASAHGPRRASSIRLSWRSRARSIIDEQARVHKDRGAARDDGDAVLSLAPVASGALAEVRAHVFQSREGRAACGDKRAVGRGASRF